MGLQRERGSIISSFLSGFSGARGTPRGAGSRQKKESKGGATYPKQSPRARRPGSERRLCLRSRRRRARLGRSQPRRAASSGGRPENPARGSGSGSGCGSGPYPRSHRPVLAAEAPPRAGPRPRPAGPPPAAAAGAGEPGLGRQGWGCFPSAPRFLLLQPPGRSAALFRSQARAV